MKTLMMPEFAEKLYNDGFYLPTKYCYVKKNEMYSLKLTLFAKLFRQEHYPAYDMWQMVDILAVAEDYFFHRYKQVSDAHNRRTWKNDLIPSKAYKKSIADYDIYWFSITLAGSIKLAVRELLIAEKSAYTDFPKDLSEIIAGRWK